MVQKEVSADVQEWRPDPGAHVARTIATRRAERYARYSTAANTARIKHLHGVILVGHSYGGMVITGVVDSVPERIAHLV